ncbi:PREDICTED: uncharacterized protein LOC104753044 [Camelina sativa]|uniref:Uncharacterized protein LOC104753044 n=1 Tax=Camelina sativa TaxID=90675 RepID=A0ABM0WNE1_CAMSA|nr:PREDICTED: uncharacterized protein LOC104753044 [Camelina sativa]
MASRTLRYREALPDEYERTSDFLTCASCDVRVIGFVVDNESDQDSLNQQGTVAPSGLLSQQQNRLSAMDLGAVISTQELGGSSTSGSNEASSSSNIPIICIYCRETGAAADTVILFGDDQDQSYGMVLW